MNALEGACVGRRWMVKGGTQPWKGAVSRSLHLTSARRTPETTSSSASVKFRLPIEVNSESKTVTTVVGELPLSPIMDPAVHEARYRFTRRKKPEAPLLKKTKFRRLLARNPYALALAEPPRMCSATHVVLPKFFLQRFRLLTRPETTESWWIAQDLQKWQPPVEGESGHGPKAGKATGPAAYFLSREDLMDAFVTRHSPYLGKQRALMRQSVRSSSPLMSALHLAVWREDMGSFLLEIMRRRVVDGLLYYAELVEKAERRYLIKCDTWDEVKRYNHRGCLLSLGDLDTDPTAVESPERSTTAALSPLSTLSIDSIRYNGKLAVHNMRSLLTEEHLHRLRMESPVFRDGSLFLLGRRRTTDLQHLLWKLQGYTSHSHVPNEVDPPK